MVQEATLPGRYGVRPSRKRESENSDLSTGQNLRFLALAPVLSQKPGLAPKRLIQSGDVQVEWEYKGR